MAAAVTANGGGGAAAAAANNSGAHETIEMHEANGEGGGAATAPTTTPDGTTLQGRVICGVPTGVMGAALVAELVGLIVTAYLASTSNPAFYVGTGLFGLSGVGTGFGGYYAYKYQQMGPLFAQVRAMTQNVAKLGAVEGDLKQRDLELGQIRTQLQTTAASLQQTTEKLTKAESDLRETAAQLETSATQLEVLKKAQDETLADLAKERLALSQTKDQLATLTKERETLTGDQTKNVEQLTAQNAALAATNKQLTDQVAAMQASIDKLKITLQGYLDQNKVFQDALAKMGKGAQNLTDEDQRLVASIQALDENRKRETAAFDQELDALAKEVQQSKVMSEGLINLLASQNQKLQQEIEAMDQTVAGFQRAEDETAAKTRELEQLQQQSQAAQSKLEALAAQLAQTEAALDRAKQDLKPLEAKLGDTADRVDHQAGDLGDLNKNIDRLLAGLGAAVADAEAHQAGETPGDATHSGQ